MIGFIENFHDLLSYLETMNRSYYTTKLRYLRKCTKTGKTFALPLKLDTDKVCLGENFVVCTTHRYLINI